MINKAAKLFVAVSIRCQLFFSWLTVLDEELKVSNLATENRDQHF
jgi:hypothetical protein